LSAVNVNKQTNKQEHTFHDLYYSIRMKHIYTR